MAQNNSVAKYVINETGGHVIFVGVLGAFFLLINSVLIATFFMKDIFYTNLRYILFAMTLLSDSMILIVTNFLVILSFSRFPIPMWICFIAVIISSVYNYVTPVTLTAMSLERYVAICMPLRHADLCCLRRAPHCILIVHCISCIPSIITQMTFFSLVHFSIYTQSYICSVELFLVQNWQGHLRSAVGQVYFAVMLITIIICYVQIIKIAKSASGENRQAMWKGMRTVLLHAIQLLLSVSYMWCPMLESAVRQIDFNLFISVRFFNYITFSLFPRCLSPLIYGVRDETFFLALKSCVVCGCVNNKAFKKTKLRRQT